MLKYKTISDIWQPTKLNKLLRQTNSYVNKKIKRKKKEMKM
jgi:hypothetical protein